MPCTDCNDCLDPKPDSCIIYTGEDIDELGICSGKTTLYEIEAILLQKIQDFATGEGISLEVGVDCTFLSNLVKDKTLSSLIQGFSDGICALHTSLTTIQGQVAQPTVSFQTGCLTLPSGTPTRDQILQALLTKACSMDTRISAIEINYVKATDLNTLITQYLASQPVTQQYQKMVPYVAYEYYGPLSNFSSGGVGIAANGFQKVYLCNGQSVNGFQTPDRRGRVAVGAVQGVPGGDLDPEVDPSLPANAGITWNLKQKAGVNNVTLDITQIPAHNHDVIDPGHSHALPGNWTGSAANGNGKSTVRPDHDDGTHSTTQDVTGITIGAAGGSQSHTNLQPSIAAYFIIFIP